MRPVGAKGRTLRVTTVRPRLRAVAAINASAPLECWDLPHRRAVATTIAAVRTRNQSSTRFGRRVRESEISESRVRYFATPSRVSQIVSALRFRTVANWDAS